MKEGISRNLTYAARTRGLPDTEDASNIICGSLCQVSLRLEISVRRALDQVVILEYLHLQHSGTIPHFFPNKVVPCCSVNLRVFSSVDSLL